MERFIYGSLEVEGESINDNGMATFINPNISPVEYKPEFKVLSLDIETGQDGTIYSFGFHFTWTDREETAVFMRSPQFPSGHTEDYITYFRSEKDLLNGFITKFHSIDPDIIIGWHVIGFDFEFINNRFNHHNLKFNPGRDFSPISIRNSGGNWHCTMNGRVVIDGPPTLRAAFYSFPNYKLETVASEVLGEGKDINDTGKVEEIERRYREDKKALAYYNLMDCILVTRIYKKLGLIDLTFTRAITSGLTMDRVGISVAAFDFFMLPKIHRNGFVAPDTGDSIVTEQGKGGLVFSTDPGFYNSVIVLDFKSLYPSIIKTFFIDPLSRIESAIKPVKTPVDIEFSSEKHVLPEYIESLMNQRADAKKMDDPNLAQAIKILMNSFYGVMGTPLSRFYNPDLSYAITGTGQWLLNTLKDHLTGLGYRVIYGDTDSVFIELKEEERENFDSSATTIMNNINRYLKDLIQINFNTESKLEIEYEKHFSRFFLPSLRGSVGSAKKRYAGLLTTKDSEKLSFTGLEYVRSDWTDLAKEFQYQLFHRIFHDMDITPYINSVVKKLKAGEFNNMLVYKKRLTKPASEYTKMIPPQVKAAQLLDPTGEKRVKHIEYYITAEGPVPAEFKPKNIDFKHYIEKQLEPIADSILPFIGKDFNSILYGKQLELF